MSLGQGRRQPVSHTVSRVPGEPKALVTGPCGVREALFDPRFCPTCGAKLDA